MSHDDLGEIRTETAIRSTPPEKKERLGETRGVNQKRLGNSKAPPDIYLLLKFQANLPNLTSRILNNEFCVSKINIYFGGVLCQADFDWSHNCLKLLF
jgi:hypothetical protein